MFHKHNWKEITRTYSGRVNLNGDAQGYTAEEIIKNYALDIWDIVGDGGSLNDVAETLTEIIRLAQKEVVEEIQKVIGEDEEEYTTGFYKGGKLGIVKSTGEEVPLRLLQKQWDRNELKEQLRSKLSKLLPSKDL